MDTELTRALVRRFYDVCARGDRADTASMIHDHVDWICYGPVDLFPTKGPQRGKDAVLQTIQSIHDRYEIKRREIEVLLADGDRAAAILKYAIGQRSTGRTLSFRSAQLMRFQDGKLVEFREFCDTMDLARQVLGRWFKI